MSNILEWSIYQEYVLVILNLNPDGRTELTVPRCWHYRLSHLTFWRHDPDWWYIERWFFQPLEIEYAEIQRMRIKGNFRMWGRRGKWILIVDRAHTILWSSPTWRQDTLSFLFAFSFFLSLLSICLPAGYQSSLLSSKWSVQPDRTASEYLVRWDWDIGCSMKQNQTSNPLTSLAALGRCESHINVEVRKSTSCPTMSCASLGSTSGSYCRVVKWFEHCDKVKSLA